MTSAILKIACTALVLTNKNTWEAFAWNRTECGFGVAVETLFEDINGAAYELEDAWESYLND